MVTAGVQINQLVHASRHRDIISKDRIAEGVNHVCGLGNVAVPVFNTIVRPEVCA